MKKRLWTAVMAGMVLFTLSACGTQSAEVKGSSDAKPDDSMEPAAISEQSPTETANTQELTDLEMQWLFEQVYNDCHDLQLELELLDMHQSEYSNFPADYQERYIDWRPIEDTPAEDEQVPSDKANETVYAPTNVNEDTETGILYTNPNVIEDGSSGEMAPPRDDATASGRPAGSKGSAEDLPTGIEDPYDTIYHPIFDGGSSNEPDVSTTFPGQTLTGEDLATGIEDPYDTIYHPISDSNSSSGGISYDEPSFVENITDPSEIATGNENPYDTIYHPIP